MTHNLKLIVLSKLVFAKLPKPKPVELVTLLPVTLQSMCARAH